MCFFQTTSADICYLYSSIPIPESICPELSFGGRFFTISPQAGRSKKTFHWLVMLWGSMALARQRMLWHVARLHSQSGSWSGSLPAPFGSQSRIPSLPVRGKFSISPCCWGDKKFFYLNGSSNIGISASLLLTYLKVLTLLSCFSFLPGEWRIFFLKRSKSVSFVFFHTFIVANWGL